MPNEKVILQHTKSSLVSNWTNPQNNSSFTTTCIYLVYPSACLVTQRAVGDLKLVNSFLESRFQTKIYHKAKLLF